MVSALEHCWLQLEQRPWGRLLCKKTCEGAAHSQNLVVTAPGEGQPMTYMAQTEQW